MDDRVDLIVGGAGGGLVGAIRAAQLGLSVLVVEANPAFRHGNNTFMSTAMVPGAGSRFQAAAGLADSADQFVHDVMHKTRDAAEPTVTRALANVSARLVEWLADDLGLPIELVTDFDYPGHSVCRCHTVPGRTGSALLGMLTDRLAEAGVDLLVPASAQAVELTDRGVSVQIAFPDGTRESVQAGALLMAMNGFAANADMVGRYIPEIAEAAYHGSEMSRGDALRIGGELGAGVGFLDSYQGHGALAVDAGTLVGWASVMHGGIIVNRAGRRFADESQGYSEFASIELTQPDHWSAIVFDQRIYDTCLLFEDFRQTVSMGVVHSASTVAELAGKLGVSAGELESTAENVATYVSGEFDPFGRTHWPAATLSAPYYAVPVQPALFHTQGGLIVDANARVLSSSGSPIRGIYAAGGAAVGISGHGAAGYLAGNGLLSAFGLAFLAAEHCASSKAGFDS